MTRLDVYRSEMLRLADKVIILNRQAQAREAHVTDLHEAGHQNYSGHLDTVLHSDTMLNRLAGDSKTCAILAGGLAAVIEAELSIKEAHREGKESRDQRDAHHRRGDQ